MTSMVLFIAPGLDTQVWVSSIIGLLFLLLSTFYNPFRELKLNVVNFVGQLSTLLTLRIMLAMRLEIWEDGLITEQQGIGRKHA